MEKKEKAVGRVRKQIESQAREAAKKHMVFFCVLIQCTMRNFQTLRYSKIRFIWNGGKWTTSLITLVLLIKISLTDLTTVNLCLLLQDLKIPKKSFQGFFFLLDLNFRPLGWIVIFSALVPYHRVHQDKQLLKFQFGGQVSTFHFR